MLHEMGIETGVSLERAARGLARGAGGARPPARLAPAHRRPRGVEGLNGRSRRSGSAASRRGWSRRAPRASSPSWCAPPTSRCSCWPAARTSWSPTTASPARSCGCSRAGCARDGARLEVQAGEPWDELVAALRRRRPAGLRVPVGHPRLDRRDADPERRRLRPGGRRDRRVGARARPRQRPDLRAAGGATAASATARASSSTATATSCSRSRSALRESPIVGPAALRRAGAGARTCRSAARRRSPTSARPCSRCAAARAWSSTRPTPTRSAPARSSPTRSSSPTRFARLQARAGEAGSPPAFPEPDGRVKTSAAWLIERAGFRRGLRRRPRRHLHQAHARARQPRRRHHRGADGAGARDRRRACARASGSRSCPSPCSSGTTGALLGPCAGSGVLLAGARATPRSGEGSVLGEADRPEAPLVAAGGVQHQHGRTRRPT